MFILWLYVYYYMRDILWKLHCKNDLNKIVEYKIALFSDLKRILNVLLKKHMPDFKVTEVKF